MRPPIVADSAASPCSALQAAKQHVEALACWQNELSARPGEPKALAGAAIAFLGLGRRDEALALWRQILGEPVVHAPSRAGLGTALARAGCHREAVATFETIVAAEPASADAWRLLGSAQIAAQEPAAALASLEAALSHQPALVAAYCDLAIALAALDRLPEAEAACRRALALAPGSANAHFNLGAIQLAAGRMREGFANLEHRFALRGRGWVHPHVVAAPWTGEPLAGRSIFVHGEQGNGDYLHYARYLPALCAMGAAVTCIVPTRLRRLLSTLLGPITLVDEVAAPRPYDYQCPLGSLPHRLAELDRDIPAAVPYLGAEPARVAAWRTRLGEAGFRVGVAWQGGAAGGRLARGFPLATLQPLAEVPGVRLISLQIGAEVAGLPDGMAVETLGTDYDVGPDAFLDAAAAMMNLDLVVTLDSALAHLAGALARPTWIALPFAPEWRWQRGRSDSPWYPTARLFRQTTRGDWTGVFTEMAAALREPPGDQGATREPPLAVPTVPISWGELLDKITILEIKTRRLPTPEAKANVARDLAALEVVAAALGRRVADVAPDVERLREINARLWDIENELRRHEVATRFDAEFTALARSVYTLNDERAAVKRSIDTRLRSRIVEKKSY